MKFTVYGIPRPQGSKRHVGNGRMVEMSKNLPEWRTKAVYIAHFARRNRPVINGPVAVTAEFYFPRPKSHYHTGERAGELKATAPRWHIGSPDLDKLQRAIGDVLEQSGVIRNDSQIVQWYPSKRYIHEDELDTPGAIIEVDEQ